MKQRDFLRYSALVVGLQVLLLIVCWIIAFWLSPTFDSFFGLLVYFYWPAMVMAGGVLRLLGESGMIATAVCGFAFGIILYGIVAGVVLAALKRKS
jgi:hypothetical protein